jgi:hypothetical protein
MDARSAILDRLLRLRGDVGICHGAVAGWENAAREAVGECVEHGWNGVAQGAELAAILGVGGPPSVPPRPAKIAGPAARWPLKPPNSSRHLLDRITRNSRKKAENTVMLPEVDVDADIRTIQEGHARWNSDSGRYETPSGRIYGVKPGGTMFPDSGPGLVRLNRLEYEALQRPALFSRPDRPGRSVRTGPGPVPGPASGSALPDRRRDQSSGPLDPGHPRRWLRQGDHRRGCRRRG